MKKQNKDELRELLKLENKQMYSPEQIKYRIADYCELSYEAEILFFSALSKLPYDIIDFAVERIFFLTSPPEGSGARTFLISNKYKIIILFQPLFWQGTDNDVENGIAHEIAHAYLKHRFDKPCETNNMDKEADDLASKWLKRKVTIGQDAHTALIVDH